MQAPSTNEAVRRHLLENLRSDQGKFAAVATVNDYYMSLARVVRDRLMRRWTSTARTYFEKGSRTVVYLSAEFLIGPQLGNNLINLGIYQDTQSTLMELGLSLDDLLEQEPEPGLGNGGLGRLAACYMDSLSTLQIPAIGYGIRYEFGIFSQAIRDGWQIETTDKWLKYGNPWEIAHTDAAFDVFLGGHTTRVIDNQGHNRVQWNPERVVTGIAYDIPVLGYGVNTANVLRLWKAEAAESFDFQAFNVGDYYRAVDQKVFSENITKVLYPNDEPAVGKELRLEQQYFLVSCSLQDLIRIYLQREKTLDRFHEKYAVQLNDTHPALAVAELMRLLVDVHGMEWEKAWFVTTRTMSYTNHTLLPEALETYSLSLFQRLLPRHLEIIYEINQRFLSDVRAHYPGDDALLSRLSLFEESGEKKVRMANLACVGSHAINGVAELHSDLLKTTVLSDFYRLSPDKFTNVTNGVTPRRFMLLSNPELAHLITDTIGDTWPKNLEELKKLEALADDTSFCGKWVMVKLARKRLLAEKIKALTDQDLDCWSLFDVQTKRIHEYKRQILNILHVLTLYNRIKQGDSRAVRPRTFIFGGKAAPGYFMAKLIIKLINSVAELVNHDPEVNKFIRVIFFPDFNVKNAHLIYPAADLSEQISTAGMEASGTGNMKFSMNGALTIGTLDGANIEIRNAVGAENFFTFGLTVEEVARLKSEGYNPRAIYEQNRELHEAMNLIGSGRLSPSNNSLFHPLLNSLLDHDHFMVLADYPLYIECQEKVSNLWHEPKEWTRMSILNVARMGIFSSDRAIKEYCQNIWHVEPVPVELDIIQPLATI
ncbi:MAG: glycogen/starch/alpha-glucan phosphorylase [Candidatus Melainabacteria bacterium]|nr:glycogen/starch/alpha-glucan phosphorylase [Candidatus Melainabacteria bacterium]